MRSPTDKRVWAIQRGRTAVPSISVRLAMVLLFYSASPALHALELPDNDLVETAEQRQAAKIKGAVTRRGAGHTARLRVKLRDKHELKGHIVQINEDSFQMVVDQDGLDTQSAQDRLITIRYSEVEKIRGPRSPMVNVAIGVGLGSC